MQSSEPNSESDTHCLLPLLPRAAIARGCGHPSYADLQLSASTGARPLKHHLADAEQDTSAGGSHCDVSDQQQRSCVEGSHTSPEQVLALLEACAEGARQAADAQVQAVAAVMASHQHKPPLGGKNSHRTGQIEAWDVQYGSALLATAAGASVDTPAITPYLTLEGVMRGLSETLSACFGLQLSVMPHTPTQPTTPTPTLQDTLPPPGSPSKKAGTLSSSLPSDVWDAEVVALQLEDPVTGKCGVIYLHPGGRYGTRLLQTNRAWGTQPPVGDTTVTPSSQPPAPQAAAISSTPQPAPSRVPPTHKLGTATAVQQGATQSPPVVVACGLVWSWAGQQTHSPEALWELCHELGHGVHLVLSSCQQPFAAFGGLQLPLESLEVGTRVVVGWGVAGRVGSILEGRNRWVGCAAKHSTSTVHTI